MQVDFNKEGGREGGASHSLIKDDLALKEK
jgi:hypothetical protein